MACGDPGGNATVRIRRLRRATVPRGADAGREAARDGGPSGQRDERVAAGADTGGGGGLASARPGPGRAIPGAGGGGGGGGGGKIGRGCCASADAVGRAGVPPGRVPSGAEAPTL